MGLQINEPNGPLRIVRLDCVKVGGQPIRCETDYATGNQQDPVYVDDYTSVNEGLLNNKLSRTALKDGVVKYERKGIDKKQVSVY